MEIKKVMNINWIPFKLHKKIIIKYNTLNKLLNALDIDWKKIDNLIRHWHSLDEAILILLWESH